MLLFKSNKFNTCDNRLINANLYNNVAFLLQIATFFSKCCNFILDCNIFRQVLHFTHNIETFYKKYCIRYINATLIFYCGTEC